MDSGTTGELLTLLHYPNVVIISNQTATATTGAITLYAISSSLHAWSPAEDIGSLFQKLSAIPSGDTIGRDRNAIRDPRPCTLRQCVRRLTGGKNGRSGGRVNGRINRACVAGRTRDSWGGTW